MDLGYESGWIRLRLGSLYVFVFVDVASPDKSNSGLAITNRTEQTAYCRPGEAEPDRREWKEFQCGALAEGAFEQPRAMADTIDVDKIKQMSWTTTTTYTPSNIITYNIALGVKGDNLSRCFEGHHDFSAVPTFGTLPVIAIMDEVTRSMVNFLPNFQGHNHVHGEHFLELRQPFPRQATLKTTAKIVDIVDRRSGVTVAVGITTIDTSTGQEICYNEWTSFVMKVPGQGASTTPIPRGPATASHPAPTSRPPDAVVEYKTSPEQGALYRAASGDLNPLHIDPAVARAGGFPGPILTGTCTLGMGVLHVIDSFAEGDFSRFKTVKVRLSKPVFPGEVVKTEMWREENGRKIVYRQVVGEGKEQRVVISQAAVELEDAVASQSSSTHKL